MTVINPAKKYFKKLLQGRGYAVVKVPRFITLTPELHLYYSRLFDSISEIEGDIVECGVGYGRSLLSLLGLARNEGRSRMVWGFDSFEGFPEPSEHDQGARNPQKGEWNVTTPEKIRKLFGEKGFKVKDLEHLKLVKGFFNESLKNYNGKGIALLHLDVDLYESYKQCLEQLWPKIVPGGVILFDEYRHPKQLRQWPGAAKAIDEFFGEQKKFIRLDNLVSRYYIYKT